MNELIKVTNNNGEQLVSARELHDFLATIDDFKDFFVQVSKLKVELDKKELKILLKELGQDIYYSKFGCEAIIYLKDTVTSEMTLGCKNVVQNSFSEKEMKKYIIKNFEVIFPKYKYLGQEIKVENIGRIDILAIDKESDRHVIIELKLKNKNPNPQLLAYSKKYKNPVLIAITEEKTKEISGVEYFIFSDLKNRVEKR